MLVSKIRSYTYY